MSNIKFNRLANCALSRINDISDVSTIQQRMNTKCIFLIQSGFGFLHNYRENVYNEINQFNTIWLYESLQNEKNFTFPRYITNLFLLDKTIVIKAISFMLESLNIDYQVHSIRNSNDLEYFLLFKFNNKKVFINRIGIFFGMVNMVKSFNYEFNNVVMHKVAFDDFKMDSIIENFFNEFHDLIVSYDLQIENDIKIELQTYLERQQDEINHIPAVTFNRFSQLLINGVITAKRYD
ncbi:hypothetical protein C9J21_20680 [Photobacterium phosphoreum]|uniref:hypothetical protein n=1 Tax=Photobacterium phosphoreum TaxID=659 RepID=UPI000D15133D|nr:hypothetical protein [Photobacterium phosphoreum]PSW28412.1 hypothetical protein C9J21_20680 [Photobacterium phosphoreum]